LTVKNFALLIFLPLAGFGQKVTDHDIAWILDVKTADIHAGTVASTSGSVESRDYGGYRRSTGNASTVTRSRTIVNEFVFVQTRKLHVVGRRQVKYVWSKRSLLTIGAETRAAVKGRHLFVRDDNGKEQKFEVVTKELRSWLEAPIVPVSK